MHGNLAIVCLVASLAFGKAPQENHSHTMDANGMKAGHAVDLAKVKAAKSIVGKAAPDFETFDSTGKQASLAGLRSKPLVLVFIQKGCPCCRGGKPYFDRIKNVYGDVANIRGVVVGSQSDAAAWASANKPQFDVLSDPDGKVAAKFQAADGLFTVLVSPKGIVDRAYAGYSQPMLRELTQRVASLAKIKDRKMEVGPAPMSLTSGCPLNEK